MTKLPFLDELLPKELEPAVVLVEFDPESPWYEASLTIAADAIESGIKTDYHTLAHSPDEVDRALRRLGVDVEDSGRKGRFLLKDSYSETIALATGRKQSPEAWWLQPHPVELRNREKGYADQHLERLIKGKREGEVSLHIDDNTSIFLEYNSEEEIVSHWRREVLPTTRAGKGIFVHSLVRGVGSDSFVKQFESLSDAIIDFKSEEMNGKVEHLARARIVRGRDISSAWRLIKVDNNGRVSFPSEKVPERSESAPKPEPFRLSLLRDLVPEGLDFGANYLVEFESSSLWYETSLTMAAEALSKGVRTDYHTFTHIPAEVRRGLADRGVDVGKVEANDMLRIWDSYTVQTGIGQPEKIGRSSPREKVDIHSVKLEDWNAQVRKELKSEVAEVDTCRLHIDDDTSVLLQYNAESSFLQHWRQVAAPYSRRLHLIMIHSVVSRVHTDSFYKQFESFSDGIIDLVAVERGGRIEQMMRVRMMRGKSFDSHWRRLQSLKDGNVTLEPVQVSSGEEVHSVTEQALHVGEFEFESKRGEAIFHQLAADFLHDYMVANYMENKSGWRSLVEIARETRIPVSSLYPRGGAVRTPLGELVKRGIVEIKLSPGERGRGGKITKVRVAYEKEPVRNYVNRTATIVAKKKEQ